MIFVPDQSLLIAVSDADFAETVLADIYSAFVFFYSDTCAACHQMASFIEYFAETFPFAHFYRMDVDRNDATPASFKVPGTPALAIFRDGELVSMLGGRTYHEKFVQWFTEEVIS